MNLWLIFGLLAPVLWGISNVLGSAIRRRYVKNDYALTWFLAMMRLPFVVALLIIHPVELVLDTTSVMLMIGGLLWVIPFVLYYYSLNFEEPSRVALYLQFVVIFTLILGYFWLGERLSMNQWIAFILLFTGGILAAFKHASGKWHFSKVLLIMAAACVCWALSDVIFRKYSVEIGDFWKAFNWYFIGSFLAGVFMVPFHKKGHGFLSHFKGLPMRGWALLFADQLIGTLGSVFFAFALHLGKASLTAVLQAVQPLSAFVFALILPAIIPQIDREDTSRRTLLIKGVSFVLIVVGLFFLSLHAQ